jgi:hypothetical protein
MHQYLTSSAVRALAAVALGVASVAANAVPFYWTDWLGTDLDPGTGFQVQGTITTTTATVTVTYTNALGISRAPRLTGTSIAERGRRRTRVPWSTIDRRARTSSR